MPGAGIRRTGTSSTACRNVHRDHWKYLHALPGADQAALEPLDAFRSRQTAASAASPEPRDGEIAEMCELAAKLHQLLGGLDH
jgi:hypothetical protein